MNVVADFVVIAYVMTLCVGLGEVLGKAIAAHLDAKYDRGGVV